METITGASSDALYIPPIAVDFFLASSKLRAVVEILVADRRMRATVPRIFDGGIAAACQAYRDSTSPHLLVLEWNDDDLAGFQRLLEVLSETTDAQTRVLVIGKVNDIHLYRHLKERGVSDYLVTPLTVPDLLNAIATVFSEDATRPLGRIISVMGARGGVGASTIAHLLATSLARDPASTTLLVDLDFAFGTVGLAFNQDPIHGLLEALVSSDKLDRNGIDRLTIRVAEHLGLLPATGTLDRIGEVTPEALEDFMRVVRSSAPYIVLDLPHGYSLTTRRVLELSDTVILVVSPELASLRNAKSVLDTLKLLRPSDPPPILVMSMIGMPKRPEISPSKFAQALGVSDMLKIQCDTATFTAAFNEGKMVSDVKPNHPATLALNRLADTLVRKPANTASTGLLHRLVRSLVRSVGF